MLTIVRSCLFSTQALSKNVLYIVCSALTTYFERSQILLPVVKHLLSVGYSLPWYTKLAALVHRHYHVYLSCSACCKIQFLVEVLSLQIFPSYPYTYIDIYLCDSKLKNLVFLAKFFNIFTLIIIQNKSQFI